LSWIWVYGFESLAWGATAGWRACLMSFDLTLTGGAFSEWAQLGEHPEDPRADADREQKWVAGLRRERGKMWATSGSVAVTIFKGDLHVSAYSKVNYTSCQRDRDLRLSDLKWQKTNDRLQAHKNLRIPPSGVERQWNEAVSRKACPQCMGIRPARVSWALHLPDATPCAASFLYWVALGIVCFSFFWQTLSACAVTWTA
jgi:hypothetical protein